MSNEKEQSQTQEIRDVNYQYFMVNECAEGLPIYSLDLRPEVFYRIKIWKINTPLVWEMAFWTKFLDKHAE